MPGDYSFLDAPPRDEAPRGIPLPTVVLFGIRTGWDPSREVTVEREVQTKKGRKLRRYPHQPVFFYHGVCPVCGPNGPRPDARHACGSCFRYPRHESRLYAAMRADPPRTRHRAHRADTDGLKGGVG